MFISLPNEYVFVKGGRVCSYINEERILKIYDGQVYWDDLMYALAYNLNKIKTCPYCGKPIRKKKLELDHMFPRDYGGVSITNNLIPCCSDCNSDKGNLNIYEYKELINKHYSKRERGKEKHRIIKAKEGLRLLRKSFLPRKWIKKININKLKVRSCYSKNKAETKRVTENIAYIKKFGCFKRPILVDKNLYIVDGYTWYLAAKKTGKLNNLPVIKMENVEIIF